MNLDAIPPVVNTRVQVKGTIMDTLSDNQTLAQKALATLNDKPLVFIGLMGAGKSVIGRMTAQVLGLDFVDSDNEIEKAAQMSVADIFESYGEEEFRALENRVLQRILSEKNCIISTGGGAFMHEGTRQLIKKNAFTIWLDADLDILWERVNRKNHRPLLKTDNPKETLANLITARYPIYATADFVIKSRDVPKSIIVKETLEQIALLNGQQA